MRGGRFAAALAGLAIACGTGTAGTSNDGFTLYDGLTGATLDGQKYLLPERSRSIQSGALALQIAASNLESSTVRGVRPSSYVSVSDSGASRVTTWQATIAVPSATTSTLTGTATIQAAITLSYQPLTDRLAFPASEARLVVASLGLQDAGSGLQFYRQVSLCTNASCSTSTSTTNIVYDDGVGSSALPVGQAASYATAYTFTLSLDENTNFFTYSISGGSLGVRIGSANASALFTAQGVNPVTDFLHAQLRVRAYEKGTGSGSSGTMLATFDDVYRGNAGAAATRYDDFTSTFIDPTKWNTGEGAVAMNGGALELRPGVTSPAGAATSANIGVTPDSIPVTANQIKVDVTISAETGTGSRFAVWRAFYNDGSNGSGTTPDINQAGSMVGDVYGQINLTTSSASFYVFHATGAGSSAGPVASTNGTLTPSAGHPLGVGTTHTLTMGWDPTSHQLTFQLDDATPVVVDPTSASDPHMLSALPYSAARRVDWTQLVAYAGVSAGSPGASGSTTVRLNNIYYK